MPRESERVPGPSDEPKPAPVASADETSRAEHGTVAASLAQEDVPRLISRLEAEPARRDEYQFHKPFNALRRQMEERGEAPPLTVIAEELAFILHAHDNQDPSIWDLYFGPFMSGVTKSGEPWAAPPLSAITADVLGYWRERVATSTHPVMRARYADLLWEMPKKIEGARPDAGMARVAIDSYLDAVQGRRYEHDVTRIAKGRRALNVATLINDPTRIVRARDALIALEDEVAEDESAGLWGFCFDDLLEPPNRRVTLTDDQRQKLVGDLEARLARFEAREPDEYHPLGPEEAALRLANHYRRSGRNDDAARVLRVCGRIVRRMRGRAAPLVVAHSLEQLYGLYKTFGLHQDADDLNEDIRIAGEESLADMKEVTVEGSVPSDKVHAYFAAMLAGSREDVILRIAAHFIPKREEMEKQIRELASKAPISYLVTHAVIDEAGRTIAQVGPLQEDLEGHVLRHLSQNMQLAAWWLREAMSRATAAGLLSADALLAFLLASPVFEAKRRPILQAGIEAFCRADGAAAIHILVPQIERTVRQLAQRLGAPIYRPRRGGGLQLRLLDDLLTDPAIVQALGEDIRTYLRGLFTDPRGWNVRNDVCHGLSPVGLLQMPVADRVVHALLVLALVREEGAAEEAK